MSDALSEIHEAGKTADKVRERLDGGIDWSLVRTVGSALGNVALRLAVDVLRSLSEDDLGKLRDAAVGAIRRRL